MEEEGNHKNAEACKGYGIGAQIAEKMWKSEDIEGMIFSDTMTDSSQINQVEDILNDIVISGGNSGTPTTPTVSEKEPIEPTEVVIGQPKLPIEPTEVVIGTPKSTRVTPSTTISGTSGAGARRRMEMETHDQVPIKKSRPTQEEILKRLMQRIEAIEKEIELGTGVLHTVEKLDKSIEALQKSLRSDSERHTAGMHAELKKGQDENTKHHQGLRVEVHATARKIDGLVQDSATVKDLLNRIQMVANDSRHLLFTKLSVSPTPSPAVAHSSFPVASKESSSNQWNSTNHTVQEYEQVKENVAPQQYPQCAFCSGTNHPSNKCNKLPTWKARRNLLYSQSRCWSCLGPQHDGDQCQQEGIPCKTCQGLYTPMDSRAQHHEAICENHYLGEPIESLTANFANSNRGKGPGRGRGRGRGSHRGKI
ncbi:hypothetical protein L5515_005016 [Caenorhabditis briggsae]|uniref:Uncharacterized protein n=1 Tax=Caenorhabditis briggsae TaxID=6238 RepID=A0AAE9JDL8_CAEBR|nr:hypothetical protein L5515_005016 [Caenorhabditis briggsae]